MGKRTHGPHLLNAIDANDHKKVHEILAIQIKNKGKIHEVLTSEIRRLASEYFDCPLLVATSLQDPSILKYLITKHNIDPNFVHTKGIGKKEKKLPLLLLAVKRGLYQTVEALLTLNADANITDHKGRGPLYHAVRRANCRMTKMLLHKGAKANQTDLFGNTPLHTATRFGHMELVKLLLQFEGDLYKRDQSGALPIHIAAKEGHIPLLQLFCLKDVNVNTKVPCYAEQREVTPLHVAAEEGHTETVLALLEQFGAEVNLTDSEGETPLHCCVIKEYDPFGMKSKDDLMDTAKILIKFGADPNIANGRGETPLHHAARNEFQKIVELLLAVGADATIEDNDKNKPIDLVSEEDTVSKLALKRAIQNREKVMSNFMEMRARGMSGSITSMPGYQGSMSNISVASPMGSLMRGRSMSNPGLLDQMDNRSLLYEDGYLLPLGGATGQMGSMTSLNSAAQMTMNMNVNAMNMSFNRMNMGMPMGLPPRGLSRQGSTSSFNSAATGSTVTYGRGMDNTYARIDSDNGSIISDGPQMFGQRFGGSARWDQAGRKKKSLEQMMRQRAYNDVSSDSSQYDENVGFRRSRSMSADRGTAMNLPAGMVLPPQSSTPVKYHPVVAPKPRLNIKQNLSNSGPQSPKSPTGSQQSFHSARHSAGSSSPKRSPSVHSNQSGKQNNMASSPKVQDTDNSSFWDVNPNTTASTFKELSNSRDGSVSSSTSDNQPTPHAQDQCKGELDTEAVYANMPEDCENDALYDNIPDKVQDNLQKISIQSNQQQQIEPTPLANGTNGVISDSDDTFFDDESFDTLSDFIDAPSKKGARDEPMHIKTVPLPLQRPTEPPPPSPTKAPERVSDPKLQTWLAEQATIIRDRQLKDKNENNNDIHLSGTDPVIHNTQSLNHFEHENIVSVSETHSYSDDEEKMNTIIRRKVVESPKPEPANQENGEVEMTEKTEIKREEKKKSKSKTKSDKVKTKKKKRRSSDKGEKESPTLLVTEGSPEVKPPQVIPKVQQSPVLKPKPKLPPKPKPRKISSQSQPQQSHTPIQDQLKHELLLKQQQKMEDQQAEHAEEAVYMNHDSVPNGRMQRQPSVEDIINESSGLDISQEASMTWDDMEGPAYRGSLHSQSGAARQGETEYMEMKDCVPEPDDEDVFAPNSSHVLASNFDSSTHNISPDHNLVVEMRENKGPSPVGPRHSFTNAKYVPVPGAQEISDRLIEMDSIENQVTNEYNFHKTMTEVNTASPESIERKMERRMSESDLLDMDDSRADDIVHNHVLNIQKYQLQQRQQVQPAGSMEPEDMPAEADQPQGTVPASPQRTSPSHMYAKVNKTDKRISDSSSISMTSGPIYRSSPVQNVLQKDAPDIPAIPTPGVGENFYEELPSPKRKVTIGAEEIIPLNHSPPKDHDHRRIIYSTGGKMRISVIGGNSDGIFVHRIDPGSDAEQKGLREGDQILKINGKNMKGKTKEDASLMLMAARNKVDLLVRYRKNKYDWCVENGGMGDAFFVKALFNYNPTTPGEMKITKNDVFSVRDTLPDGKMGSWRALKVNAKPNEPQHGMIPNAARAEQAALAEKRKQEVGLDKEQRGGFLRRSLRRAKSAERLDKENKALSKVMPPIVGEIKAYEKVEQKPVGFVRPIILLGLFCDTARDRLLKDSPGLFEAPPPEVEIPARDTREEGGAKIPVNVDLIQETVDKSKHCLMIVSPKAINYLQTTHLFPIVIYLSPGSKMVIKALRAKLAPDFDKRSSFMYDEAVHFEKAHMHLFTATVTYTVDDSWFTLLKDTIGRIQNQPIWQPTANIIEDNEDFDYPESSPHKTSKKTSGASINNEQSISSGPPMMKPLSQTGRNNKQNEPKPNTSPIPDSIANVLQKHQSGGDTSFISTDGDVSMETTDLGIRRPKATALTYDGYFLSDPSKSPSKVKGSGNVQQYMNGGGFDDMEIGKPRSILKKRPSQTSQDGPLGASRRQSGSEPDLNSYPMLNGEVPTFTRKGRVNFNTTEISFKEKQDLLRQKALEEQATADAEAAARKKLEEEERDKQQKMLEEQQLREEEEMRLRMNESKELALKTQLTMQKKQTAQVSLQQQMFMQHVLPQQPQQQKPMVSQQQQQQHMRQRPVITRRRPQPQTNPQVSINPDVPLIHFHVDENWRNLVHTLLSHMIGEKETINVIRDLATKPEPSRKECIADIIELWLSRNGDTLLESKREQCQTHIAKQLMYSEITSDTKSLSNISEESFHSDNEIGIGSDALEEHYHSADEWAGGEGAGS